MNDEPNADKPAEPPKKAPRKPRPSEIAAKKAKAAAAKKKAVKKPKTKPRPLTAKGAKKRVAALLKRHKAKSKRPAAKKAKVSNGVVRSERLDMRLTKAEKARVKARAVKLRRTITSVILEAVERVR